MRLALGGAWGFRCFAACGCAELLSACFRLDRTGIEPRRNGIGAPVPCFISVPSWGRERGNLNLRLNPIFKNKSRANLTITSRTAPVGAPAARARSTARGTGFCVLRRGTWPSVRHNERRTSVQPLLTGLQRKATPARRFVGSLTFCSLRSMWPSVPSPCSSKHEPHALPGLSFAAAVDLEAPLLFARPSHRTSGKLHIRLRRREPRTSPARLG